MDGQSVFAESDLAEAFRIGLSQPGVAEALTQVAPLFGAIEVGITRLFEQVMPGIERVAAYIAQPKVQSALHHAAARLSAGARAIEAVESPGYVPYFEELGKGPFEARLLAAALHHCARVVLAESQGRKAYLKAVTSLGHRRRWHPAIVAQAEILRCHDAGVGVLQDAFEASGSPQLEQEFLAAVDGASRGDRASGLRLIEISARIQAHLPSARGRPLTPARAMHEMLLEMGEDLGVRQGYTYGPIRGRDDRRPSTRHEDFVDGATAATRKEIGVMSFSPTASRASVRARRKAQSNA